jgi:Zn-dependent protease with chaperone function
MLVYGLVSRSVAVIPVLLSFAVFGLVISLISWHNEYEADAVAAEYVGKECMVYALEQVAQLLHRRRDTYTHPSFKRRISRLLSDKE